MSIVSFFSLFLYPYIFVTNSYRYIQIEKLLQLVLVY